jgi:phosphohistidine phosphatase
MDIYLVRHAIARPREDAPTIDDSERPLTATGIRRFKRCVRALSVLGMQVDEIWTSPLRRARETAELLARLDSFEGNVRILDWLGPGGPLSDGLLELRGLGSQTGIALVGHEPDLSRLAGLLLAGRDESMINLKKGGVARLEMADFRPEGRCRLLWLLTPGHLRRVRP